ncbi:hypothetical protein WJX81_006135 [Elliptochloris bilobata]|uniref:XPA C-terminal domain-containing protein n=1 Tax=Elliptochloris bilobata TaxID=381761 RepID=A0AAW1SDD2_9CHLO
MSTSSVCTRIAKRLVETSTAKELYLITDNDLRKLGCLARINPQHKEWAPLKLYMQSQVEVAAFAKHGGPDGLEEARLRRIDTRTEARKKKRTSREAKDDEMESRYERVKQRILAEAARPALEPAGKDVSLSVTSGYCFLSNFC